MYLKKKKMESQENAAPTTKNTYVGKKMAMAKPLEISHA